MNIFKIILFVALTPLYCATEHNPFMRVDSDSSWDEIGSQTPLENSTTWTFVPELDSRPKSPFEEILSPEILKIGSKKNLNYFYQKITSAFPKDPKKFYIKQMFFNFMMMFYQVDLSKSIRSQQGAIPINKIQKVFDKALKKLYQNGALSTEEIKLIPATFSYLKKTYLNFSNIQ